MMKQLLLKILFSSILLGCANWIYAASTQNQINNWLQRDGYIVISEPVNLDTLDPTLPINAHSKFTLPLIFESLINISPQQELQPILAKSWQVAPDSKSIVINIKPNHHFSDNSEVTAQDVVNSIYRLCSTKSQMPEQLRGLVNCTEHAKGKNVSPQVYVNSKYQVKFNINSSPTAFLYQLSSPSAVIAKETKLRLVGSGPYIAQEKNKDYLILNKNKFYVGDISIKNSGIIMFYVSDQDITRTIIQDKPDGALMYRMESLSNLNENNYKLIKSNPNITELLVFNNQRFPFNKPLVRKALSSEIYNNFKKSCAPGAHKAYGIIPYGLGGSLDNMAPEALPEITPSELFSQIPQLKNKRVKIIIHQLDDIKNNCESDQIIKAANKYHIDIKFKYHKDYSDLLPILINHNLDGFIDLYIFRNREAYNILEFFSQHGKNNANIDNDAIDDMLKEAISISSSHERYQIYRKIAQYIQSENIIIPLFYMDHGNLMSKCLSGISEDFFYNPFLELPKISKIKNCKNL
jgi:ABC-type transport system substrate-binding protein